MYQLAHGAGAASLRTSEAEAPACASACRRRWRVRDRSLAAAEQLAGPTGNAYQLQGEEVEPDVAGHSPGQEQGRRQHEQRRVDRAGAKRAGEQIVDVHQTTEESPRR